VKLVWVSPRADRDLDRIADYYVEQGGAPLGLRFYAAVSQTFDRLADFPESSPRVTSDHSAIDGWRVAVVDPPFSRVLAY